MQLNNPHLTAPWRHLGQWLVKNRISVFVQADIPIEEKQAILLSMNISDAVLFTGMAEKPRPETVKID